MKINLGKLGRTLSMWVARLAPVAKAAVAAIGTLATVLVAVLADNALGLDEVETVVAAVVTAAGTVYGVWRTPNRP